VHILYWIVVGLVAGGLAKALTPGSDKEPKGCLMTMLLGIGGSLLVGFIMSTFLDTSGGGGLIGTIIGATIGAMLLIFLFRKLWK
jgi:uncharacterized membrane protein YeaQ/YmgE (transglycosylase-associated protein family)